MNKDIEPIECNMPFERVPHCSCDTGRGDPPTKLKMMECKMAGGPCSESYWNDPAHPERNQPNERPPVKLTDNERKILKVLASAAGDFGFYSFAGLASRTHIDRRRVRLACRSLKRKGLAEFKAGLWTDDGEPAGSGYGATKAGCAIFET